MPYASKAQQGLFHSPNSPVSAKEVAKFDRESKGEKGLPEHVGHEKKESKRAERKEHGAKKSMARANVLRAAGENGER